MVVTVSAFFGPFGKLGIVNSAFRRFNYEKSEEERQRVLSAGLCTVVFLVVVAAESLFHFCRRYRADGDRGSRRRLSLVRLGILSAALNTVGMMPMVELRARRRVKTTATLNVSKLLIGISCTLWLVVVEGQGPRGVIVGTLVGEIFGVVALLAITAKSYRRDFGLATWKPLFLFGLPLIPHQVLGLGMTLVGQYSVGKLLGLGDAGIYATALKFALPITFVVNSVQNAWTPFKYQVHANDEDPATFFRTAVTYYVAGVLYLWVGVVALGPGTRLADDREKLLASGRACRGHGSDSGQPGNVLHAGHGHGTGQEHAALSFRSRSSGLVTCLPAYCCWCRGWEPAGAAIASINSFIVLTVMIYYFSQRRFRIAYDWPALARSARWRPWPVFVGRQAMGLPVIQRLPIIVAISLVLPWLEFAILSRSPTERHRMRILWERLMQMTRRKVVEGRSP